MILIAKIMLACNMRTIKHTEPPTLKCQKGMLCYHWNKKKRIIQMSDKKRQYAQDTYKCARVRAHAPHAERAAIAVSIVDGMQCCNRLPITCNNILPRRNVIWTDGLPQYLLLHYIRMYVRRVFLLSVCTE